MLHTLSLTSSGSLHLKLGLTSIYTVTAIQRVCHDQWIEQWRCSGGVFILMQIHTVDSCLDSEMERPKWKTLTY